MRLRLRLIWLFLKGGLVQDGRVLEASEWITGALEVQKPHKPLVVEKLAEHHRSIKW